MAKDKKKDQKPRRQRPAGRVSAPAQQDGAIQLVYSDEGVQSITVESRTLPAPDRSFAADFAFFKSTPDGDYKMVFVQTEPFGDQPRSALTVRMSEANFRRLGGHAEFMKILYDGHGGDTAERREQAEKLVDAMAAKAPEKCHTDRATLARMSTLGADAEIDFYFISPNKFQDAKSRNSTIGLVSPIASVSLSAKLLSELLHRIAAL